MPSWLSCVLCFLVFFFSLSYIVLLHIRTKGEFGLNMFKHSSFLLTVLRRCFFCGSFLAFVFHVCVC